MNGEQSKNKKTIVHFLFMSGCESGRAECLVMVNCMVADGPETGRHAWIDALRVCAGVSMVGLHVTADAQGQPFPDADPAARLAPMVLRALLYTARTELFLMISVMLLVIALARRPRGYGTVIVQQARRLLVPYAFWTLFYAVFNLLKAQAFGYQAQSWAALGQPLTWVGYFVLGDVKYHMHFIPTLFAMLLFYPVFQMAEKHPSLGGMVVVGLVVKQWLDPMAYAAFWGTETLGYVVRAIKVLSYLGYGLAAGAVVGLWRRTTPEQRTEWVGPVLAFVGVLFALKLMVTLQVAAQGQWIFDHPFGYWADYLMPVGLLLIALCWAQRKWPRWVSRIAKYAFGLYLCHPIFLDLIEMFLADQVLTPSQSVAAKLAWTLPATSLFVLALSRSGWTAWTVGLGPLPGMAWPRIPQKL